MGDIFSAVGIPSVLWRLLSTMGDRIAAVGDSFSTLQGIKYIREITSPHVGDNTSAVGRVFSIVGENFISACLAIDNDEKISTCFVLRCEIFIRKFQKF